MSDNIFYIYYEISKTAFRVYNPRYKQHSTMNLNELNQLSKKYEMMAGFDADDYGLVEYYLSFRKWNDELKDNGLIQYTFYYKNKYAILGAFERYTGLKLKNLKTDNIIDGIESKYFEKCNNGGLIYCKAGVYHCYGYDYKSFYPHIMGSKMYDMKIPMRKGYEVKLDKIDEDNIQYGFYCVKIDCKNDDFNKIFNYSKKNVYTSYSLEFALKHKKEFKVSITLNTELEYNAYLYNEEDLVLSNELFGEWFSKLYSFKEKYPKNKLCKHLLSSLWGTISCFKKIHVTGDDIGEYDWGTDENCEYMLQSCSNDSKNDYYTLIQRDNQYEFNIRLKPFLLSYARNTMGDIAYKNNLSEVIRVMTDNITYKSNVAFNVENMVSEEKTTGHISFKNVMRYEVVTDTISF
jgi:hypothetical protein